MYKPEYEKLHIDNIPSILFKQLVGANNLSLAYDFDVDGFDVDPDGVDDDEEISQMSAFEYAAEVRREGKACIEALLNAQPKADFAGFFELNDNPESRKLSVDLHDWLMSAVGMHLDFDDYREAEEYMDEYVITISNKINWMGRSGYIIRRDVDVKELVSDLINTYSSLKVYNTRCNRILYLRGDSHDVHDATIMLIRIKDLFD